MHRYSSSTLKQQPTNNRQLCIISKAIKAAVRSLNVLSLKEVHLYNTSVVNKVELFKATDASSSSETSKSRVEGRWVDVSIDAMP